MYKLRAEAFFKAYEQASAFQQMLALMNQGVKIPERDLTEHCERMSILVEELNAMGLGGAAATFERGLKLLEATPVETERGQRIRVLSSDDSRKINALAPRYLARSR